MKGSIRIAAMGFWLVFLLLIVPVAPLFAEQPVNTSQETRTKEIDALLDKIDLRLATDTADYEDFDTLNKLRDELAANKDHLRHIRRREMLARYTDNFDKYSKSVDLRRLILEEYLNSVKDRDRIILSYVRLGYSYLLGGDYNNAVANFKKSLEISRKAESDTGRFSRYVAALNLYCIYLSKNNQAAAREYTVLLDQEEKLFDKISQDFSVETHDLYMLIDSVNRIVDHCRYQVAVEVHRKDFSRAKEFSTIQVTYAGKLAEKLENPAFFIRTPLDRARVIIGTFGGVYIPSTSLEEYRKQTEHFKKVYETISALPRDQLVVEDKRLLAHCLLEIALYMEFETYQAKNDPATFEELKKRTVESYQMAFSFIEKYACTPALVNGYYSLAQFYLDCMDMSNPDNVEAYTGLIEKARKNNAGYLNLPEGEIKFNVYRGRLLKKQGNNAQAKECFLKAIDDLEKLVIFRSENANERILMLQQADFLYRETAEILIDLNQGEEALNVLERLKGLQFIGGIDLAQVRVNDPQVRKVLNTIDVLKLKIEATERDLIREQSSSEGHRDKIRISHLTQTLAHTKSEFYKEVTAIRQLHPEFEKLVAVKPVRFVKLQEHIPADTVLLQYLLTPDKLYVFLITSRSFKIKSVQVKKDDIENRVREFREITSEIGKDLIRGIQPSNPAAGIEQQQNRRLLAVLTTLHADLMEPVEEDIAPYKTLAIIPSGLLYYLPFQALVEVTPGGDARYLIEDKQVVYLTNADLDTMITGEGKRPLNGAPQAFSNPDGTLKSAEQEANRLKTIFPNAVIYTGSQATKERLLKMPEETSILHLATHGILDKNDVNESYILLAGKGESSKLKQGEIFELPLSATSLVTLSACQTGLGEASPGAEIASLANAFSIAGAPSIIATLWSISDSSTNILMGDFYDNLKKGKSKAEALQSAQVKMIRDSKYGHPYYWAPFILMGDWR